MQNIFFTFKCSDFFKIQNVTRLYMSCPFCLNMGVKNRGKKKLANVHVSAQFNLNCQQLFIGRKLAKSDRNHAEDSLITHITQILSEPNHRGFSNTRQKTSFYPLTHPLSGEQFTPNQFLLSFLRPCPYCHVDVNYWPCFLDL